MGFGDPQEVRKWDDFNSSLDNPLFRGKKIGVDIMFYIHLALCRRIGAAEFPRQLIEADLWLGDLSDQVRDRLSNVPLLLTWGIHDFAFPRTYMERFREDFNFTEILRLDAKHYIQEDAPGEIAEAIGGFLSGLER